MEFPSWKATWLLTCLQLPFGSYLFINSKVNTPIIVLRMWRIWEIFGFQFNYKVNSLFRESMQHGKDSPDDYCLLIQDRPRPPFTSQQMRVIIVILLTCNGSLSRSGKEHNHRYKQTNDTGASIHVITYSPRISYACTQNSKLILIFFVCQLLYYSVPVSVGELARPIIVLKTTNSTCS